MLAWCRQILNCVPEFPKIQTTIKTATPFSTICYRTPTVQTVDGIQLTSTDDANIILSLDDGPFIIPLKGYELSLLMKLQQRIDAGIVSIHASLPGASDFYVKAIPSIVQYSEAACEGTDILVSAACTNSHGAQTAVGPKFFDRNGARWASCERYAAAGQTAEGQIICMRHH